MQARIGTAKRVKAGALLAELGPHLGQLDAELEQLHAVARVSIVHERRIGRRQRIGEYAYVHALVDELGEHRDAVLARHEIRRDNDEFLFGRAHQRREVVGKRDFLVEEEASLAILAGRSASTVAGTQIRCTRARIEFGPQPAGAAGGFSFGQRRRRRLRAHRRGQRGDRVGILAVPEGIERGRQLAARWRPPPPRPDR